MAKYGNIHKDCKQGHIHHSIKESLYCNELELRKKAGDIHGYETQKKFELVPKFVNSQGENIRAVTYTPDFVIYHDGYNEIVDVKGSHKIKTQAFTLKWKMLQYLLREKGRYKFTIEV